MKITNLEIIERIGYFRTKAELSQKALSIDIGMNIGYINRLESKKDFLPSMEVLLKIIEACGITAEEFFYANIPIRQTKNCWKSYAIYPTIKRKRCSS